MPDENFPSGFFRHVDGGIYRVVGRAVSSEDCSPMVLYEHLWPADPTPHPWARPLSEWHSRFTSICEFDYRRALRGNRQAALAAVRRARELRKGRAPANDSPQAPERA